MNRTDAPRAVSLAPSALDVPGLIRRTRREADLSQRELADELGVDQATVARWELGHTAPALGVFSRLLALAGFALVVVATDSEGVGQEHGGQDGAGQQDGGQEDERQDVQPMTDRAPLDQQGRRFPAHLDLVDETDVLTGLPRLTTPHRRRRDRLRRGGNRQADHPTMADFYLERARRREARCARVDAVVRQRRLRTPHAEPPPCHCPVECDEAPGCDPTCPCGCEAPTS